MKKKRISDPKLRLLRLARLWRVAPDTRKMPFRYSQLCGIASDTVDAVILLADKDRQSQRVSNFKNINQNNSLKNIRFFIYL
jgi:hypothetical protein